MPCPDDALLDRWLDQALAAPERDAVGAHLAACAPCAARRDARLAEERGWRAALALDAAELAQLARADPAAVWRSAAAPAQWWPALAVLGLVGAAVAWLVALPDLELMVGLANRVGLLGLALAWLLGQAWHLGAAALNALATPPLVNPTVLAAGIAAGLWLLMERPWASSLAQDPD
ncbi:MAG TPA: zf-HC2 domain-containing protein [Chloroflexota bacterium]|jgi:hypothetical protein